MPSREPLYYADYLQLDRLLDSQSLESARQGQPAHDEMLFIIVHQAYELWFKQILFELDAVVEVFSREVVEEAEVGRAVMHLGRIVEIQKLLVGQINVLETMTPLDFLDFRDYLVPASGFQSVQFRVIENRLGLRPEHRMKIEGAPYTSRFSEEDRRRLEESERQPSLFDCVEKWLERTPFLHFGEYDFWKEYGKAVEAMLARDRELIQKNPTLTEEERSAQIKGLDGTTATFDAVFSEERYDALPTTGRRLSHQAFLAALLINLYRDEPILQLPFRLLSRLMDIDEGFTTWRYRHALMAARMIGTKIGTGGTAGYDYLRDTAERHRVFNDLFSLSTYFIPRSAVPELPADVKQRMGFRFDGAAG